LIVYRSAELAGVSVAEPPGRVEVAVEPAPAGRVAEAIPPGLVDRPEGVERAPRRCRTLLALQEPVPVAFGGKPVDNPAAGASETDNVYAYVTPVVRRAFILSARAPDPAARSELVELALSARHLRTDFLGVAAEQPYQGGVGERER